MASITLPLMRSVVFPDASRIAAPPAKSTNTMYDVADINRANNVPFGIELAGSCQLNFSYAPFR